MLSSTDTATFCPYFSICSASFPTSIFLRFQRRSDSSPFLIETRSHKIVWKCSRCSSRVGQTIFFFFFFFFSSSYVSVFDGPNNDLWLDPKVQRFFDLPNELRRVQSHRTGTPTTIRKEVVQKSHQQQQQAASKNRGHRRRCVVCCCLLLCVSVFFFFLVVRKW